jgi:hypothetical protein
MASLSRGKFIRFFFRPRTGPFLSPVGRMTGPLAAIRPCQNSESRELRVVRYRQITISATARSGEKTKELSQKELDEKETIRSAKRKEQEKPWHRAGTETSTEPPDASADPTKGDHSKGKLRKILRLLFVWPGLTETGVLVVGSGDTR